MADQSIQGINAIAIARGTSEPSNTDVLWLDENLEGGLYSRLKAYVSGEWKLISRVPQEILTDLKTVDGAGSGLDADTIRGLAPSDLVASLSTGQLLVGQSDAKGLAKTAGGIVTVNQNGIFSYVTNSISHTGLTDIGTNTHAQIDTHIASTSNPHGVTAAQVGNSVSQWNANSIEGNLTNIGTLGASADGKAVVWDNATSRFVMSLVGLADGDYGDVTVGGSGTSITIDNNVVTNAKLADVATSTFKGRATAGSGDPEDLTASQARTILNVEDGATADQTAAEIKTAYESNADTNAFTDTEKTKLSGIEAGATTDQTDAEIETAYNNQVPAATQAEAEAGTSTDIKRWTPQRVKQAIDALASGGNIYTANDTVGTGRIATLTDSLTFKGADDLVTSSNIKIQNNSGTDLWDFRNDGDVYFGQNTKFQGGAYGFIFNRTTGANTLVLQYNNVNFAEFGSFIGFSNTVNLGEIGSANGLNNGLKIQGDRVRYYTSVNSAGVIHDIHADRFALFGQGFSTPSNSYFSIGSYTRLGTENISLQGSTLIKGAGTTTGTTLALYDDDTTPNKTWEWLDNGNVNINQATTFDFNNQFTTFDDIPVFDINAKAESAFVMRITAGNNSISNGARIELYETSAYNGYAKSLIFKARKTEGDIKHIAYSNSTHGFYLTSGYNASDDFNNSIVNSNRRFEIGDNLTFFQNTDLIFAPNVTTGTPALIGSENISLQGSVLMNGNVNIPNLPTSSSGLSSGDLWNENGVVRVGTSGGAIGGNTIYTADDSLTGDRIVSLDSNKLTFNPTTGNTTDLLGCNVSIKTPTGVMGVSNNGTNAFTVFDVNDNPLWIFKDNGNTVSENGKLAIGTSSNLYSSDFSVQGKTIFQAKNAGSAVLGGWAQSNGASITTMFENGKMVFGGFALIGSENISLQGGTFIQGTGTTTGTTLALYDDDTTPNKTWEWLDNGNVNIGQDSIFDLNTNKLEFKNSANTNSLLILDDNAQATISNTISGLFLQYAGSTQTGKVTVTSSSVIVNAEKFETRNQSGSHTALDIDNNSTNGKISINNSVGTQMEWSTDVVGITGSSTKIIRNNVIKAYFADTFTVFGSDNTTTISGEDISLQGSTLINSTLNMNNNRILNSVVNPSVQEATNSATFTINSDQETDGVLTAMSANTTIASPTGTPVQSQDLVFRFKDDGTARTLTWNAIFRAIGVTLPTTTVANKLTYVGCKYNSTDTKWDVVAVQQEA
jgi:hypothetical protein